jgi:hypothetical protein
MTCTKTWNRGFGSLLSSGLFALLLSASAEGGLLTVTPSAATGAPEGTKNIPVTFTVTNNTNQYLLLDYAIATITNPSDMSDIIQFSGAGGSGGLLGAPTFLAPFATGAFNYSVSSPGPPPPNDDSDAGVNPVMFSVEFSPTTLARITQAGLPNNIFAAVAHGTYFDLTPFGTLPNLPVLNQLLTFQDPLNGVLNPMNVPNGSLLYSAARADPNNTYTGQTATSVTITDTPEPATWAFAATALGMLCLRSRLSHTKCRAGDRSGCR